MRAAFYISALLAFVCLGLIGLNLYDFWYRPELPWREGDLCRVLATCMAGAFIFSVASLIFYKQSIASRCGLKSLAPVTPCGDISTLQNQ